MSKVTETKKTEIINCNGAIRYNVIEIAVKATVVETFGVKSTDSYNRGVDVDNNGGVHHQL